MESSSQVMLQTYRQVMAADRWTRTSGEGHLEEKTLEEDASDVPEESSFTSDTLF